MLAGDGYIYCVGITPSVLKINPIDKSVTTFGSHSGDYRAAALASDGNIYCVGTTGDVLRIDIAGQSLSTFGVYTGNYFSASSFIDGNIYCVGDSGVVLEIDIAGQSLSTFGVYTGNYQASSKANDRYIYCVGKAAAGNVLKINPFDKSVSTFGVYTGDYQTASLASDGNIYCVGNSKEVVKINISGQSISTFGGYANAYFAASVSNDGYIYCSGTAGNVLKINPVDQSMSTIDSNSSFYRAAATSFAGGVYFIGATGANTVVSVGGAYNVGDKAVKSSLHRVYQSAVVNRDDPEVGAALPIPSWVDIGPTNKYAMFDEEIGTTSLGDTPIVITSTPNSAPVGVALFGIFGAENINVKAVSLASGEVYNRDIDLIDNSSVVDGWTYYFEPIVRGDKFILTDIPPYTDATITVTLTGSGEVALGALVIGPQVNIGITNYNTEIQLLDFSTRERDSFGGFKIVKRAIADLVKFDVTIPRNKVSYVRRQFQSLSQVAAVYVGGDGSIDDPTVVYGYHENFINNISSPSITDSTITIQGIV